MYAENHSVSHRLKGMTVFVQTTNSSVTEKPGTRGNKARWDSRPPEPTLTSIRVPRCTQGPREMRLVRRPIFCEGGHFDLLHYRTISTLSINEKGISGMKGRTLMQDMGYRLWDGKYPYP